MRLPMLTLLLLTLTLRLNDVVVMGTIDGQVLTDVLDDLTRDSLGLQEIQASARTLFCLHVTHTHKY